MAIGAGGVDLGTLANAVFTHQVEVSATIANGASLSAAVSIPAGLRPLAIVMPATWTAANLTFAVSVDGSTYNDMYDDLGTEVAVSADASRFIALPPTLFASVVQFKVRSGTSGTPVNQGGDRTVTIVGRTY